MLKTTLIAFGLTEDDVKANSVGRLARIQRRKLIRRIANLLGTVLLLCVALGLILHSAGPRVAPGAPDFWLTLIFGAGIIERFIQLVLTGLDLAQGRVRQVDGRIHLKPLSATSAEMRIDNQIFKITTKQLLALRNKLRYTVYFSPRSKILLAAVPDREKTIETSELTSSELLLDDEKPKRGQVSLGDDGELIDLETSRSNQQGN